MACDVQQLLQDSCDLDCLTIQQLAAVRTASICSLTADCPVLTAIGANNVAWEPPSNPFYETLEVYTGPTPEGPFTLIGEVDYQEPFFPIGEVTWVIARWRDLHSPPFFSCYSNTVLSV